MIEIRLHGRGGQGAVIASEILAGAFFKEGKYVQSFPQFGVERRGAPVMAFVRVGEKEEFPFVRCQIENPDFVIVLDPTLLEKVNVLEGLKEKGLIIVNTPLSPQSLRIDKKYKIAAVDAASIAVKWGLGTKTQPIVNTAILGAFVKATNLIKLESVLAAIEEKVPARKKENVEAAKEAYEEVKFDSREEKWS